LINLGTTSFFRRLRLRRAATASTTSIVTMAVCSAASATGVASDTSRARRRAISRGGGWKKSGVGEVWLASGSGAHKYFRLADARSIRATANPTQSRQILSPRGCEDRPQTLPNFWLDLLQNGRVYEALSICTWLGLGHNMEHACQPDSTCYGEAHEGPRASP
jgi:hypothetical protein